MNITVCKLDLNKAVKERKEVKNEVKYTRKGRTSWLERWVWANTWRCETARQVRKTAGPWVWLEYRVEMDDSSLQRDLSSRITGAISSSCNGMNTESQWHSRNLLMFWLKAPFSAKSKLGKKHTDEEEPRCPTKQFSRSLLGYLTASRKVSVKLT